MMAVIERYDDIHKRFNKISSILAEFESQVTNNILQAATAAETITCYYMKKILLVEDNVAMSENIAEILEMANYKVITANNGKDGVKLALETKPDLILCDIMMPVLDGYGVLYSIHENTDVRNTPFIFLTAKGERAEVRQGMELGADDYITKPFNGTELLAAIESRLKKIETLKEDIATNITQVLSNGSLVGEELLQQFIHNSNINRYRRKQVIYKEGNRPSRLFYLLNGMVKAYKTNEDGKDLVVDLYNKGDFFGYVALISNSAYKETAEAIEDCEVAVISQGEFKQLLNEPHITTKFLKLLAKDITEKEEQLLAIAYASLREKVAKALLSLKTKYQGDDESFEISMSRENLANIAGTAIESLVRTLTDFKNEKIIDIHSDRHISILNEKTLMNMMN
jgi:CRP/FNR family transcriptional regulator, cyclic AMP receptor protein